MQKSFSETGDMVNDGDALKGVFDVGMVFASLDEEEDTVADEEDDENVAVTGDADDEEDDDTV